MTMLQESVRVSQVLTALQDILANHKPQRLYFANVELGDLTLRTVDTRQLSMADCRMANLQGTITFIIYNTLDQAIQAQAFGSEYDNPGRQQHLDIQLPAVIAANSLGSITVPLSDSAFPFMGVRVTPQVLPGTGTVRAKALYQRWTEVEL